MQESGVEELSEGPLDLDRSLLTVQKLPLHPSISPITSNPYTIPL